MCITFFLFFLCSYILNTFRLSPTTDKVDRNINLFDSIKISDYGGQSDYGGRERGDYGGQDRGDYGGQDRGDYGGQDRGDYEYGGQDYYDYKVEYIHDIK